MSNTLNLGTDGEWATKENSLLGYNSENDTFKPLPFDFTRASNGTRVNKAGLIETVGNGIPRIDFLGNTEGALLLEPQRTNLVTNSSDFSSGWIYDDSTITNNSAISPDGTQNAGLWIGSTISSRHNIGAIPAPLASVTGSFSLFVKAKELKYLQIASANTVNQYVNFDVEDGIIGTVGSSFSNAKIEDYGNGWYRCSVVSPNQYNGFYISLVSGLNSTWLESWVMPNNTDGLYIYGAQVEQASYSTSYIKTEGSAVTRLADSCSQTTPDGIIGQTEGTVLVDFNIDGDISGNRSVAVLSSGGSADFVASFIFNNLFYARIRANNGSLIDVTKSNLTSGNHKIAIAYASNDLTFYLDGNIVGQNTSASVSFGSELSTIKIGESTSGTAELGGLVSKTLLYNTRLSNSELAELTQV